MQNQSVIVCHIHIVVHVFISCSVMSQSERRGGGSAERNETSRGKENALPLGAKKCYPMMIKGDQNQAKCGTMLKENQNSANWHQVPHQNLLSFSSRITSVQQSLESVDYEEELPPLVSRLPSSEWPPRSGGNSSSCSALPPIGLLPLPDCQENLVTCVIEPAGNLALRLRAGVVLDIYPSMALRLHNTRQDSTLALSPCASQLALVHPVGRLLQYATRIEVQVEDMASVKNAKIHPKGVSFTANNMALVYLLDEAGARSCADMFHDLYATHIANTLFAASKEVEEVKTFQGQTRMGAQLLEQVQYWRDSIDHWVLGDVEVAQTKDGLVTVQRRLAGDTITLKTSPNNGKVRYDSRHLQVYATVFGLA